MPRKFESRLELHIGTIRYILADAFEIKVTEIVNGEFYVTFLYPRLDDDAFRYDALIEDNDIVFPQKIENGQRFRIRRVEEVREGQRIYKIVEAHHVAFTLGNYFMDDYIDFAAGRTLQSMLTLLGADTPFTFAVEGSFAVQDIFDFGEKKKIDLLQELRQLYGAELSFNNYEITLTTRKGGNYGARVRYAHNMKGIRKTSHNMEQITRLYGYGKNGLTIEGLPGYSVKFIDSPYLDPNNPKMDKMEWPEIDTQSRLLQEMQKYLAKRETPNASYQVDFIQMEKVDPDFMSERIREAGDTVTCLDSVLGYSFDSRAIEFTRYPFEPKRGNAVLANFRPLKTSDYIFQATVGSKQAISYTSKNAVLKGVKYDDSLTLVDGLGMKVTDDQGREMVRLGQTGPGEYGQVMFNKAGAKTIWQDAATGDAHFSGILYAAGGSIGGWQITSNALTGPGSIIGGLISGSTVSGAVITGGSIYGAYIATSEGYPKVEISNTQNLIKVSQDAQHFVLITPIGDNPSIQLYDGVAGGNMLLYNSGGVSQIGSTGSLRVAATLGDLILESFSGFVRIANWSTFFSVSEGQTLKTALDVLQLQINTKANAFSGLNGRVYVAVTNGGPAEFPLDLVNGVCT